MSFARNNKVRACLFQFPALYFGIMLEVATPSRQRHKLGLHCHFNNDYECLKISKHIWNKLDIPPNACHFHDCTQCVTVNETFIIGKEFQLIPPTTFILRNSRDITDSQSTAYNCFTTDRQFCECDDNNCQGTPEFCKFRPCVNHSDCSCEMTYEKLELLAVFPEDIIYNPDILILEICYFDKRQISTSKKFRRHLLEGEKATFSQRNLSFTFEDPILHLPDSGKVILRSDDFEHVMNVPSDNIIIIPFEYLAYKADIQVTYLHPTGKVITGQIHVTGKTVCQLRHCFLCYEVIKHFKCYPAIIQYAMYTLFIMLIVILLWCLKLILKSFKFTVYALLTTLYALGRLVKIIARCSLLVGTFIGSTFREIVHNGYVALERNAIQRANVYTLPLVLLMCTCILTTVSASCNTHTIIKSDLKSCEVLNDGTKNCQIFTTAEISLKSLSAENCLWFSDEHDNHLFTLKLKLDAVTCSFNKERLYFTFPVTTKQISQISCIFNRYCGRGVHCIKRYIGKGGINFEAETSYSRQFPGFSACLNGGSGNGCFVVTRGSCNFHRVWYEPDLLNSYEVSKLTGHSCKYHVSVTNVENNTVSRLSISDTSYTPNGIRIAILGAYDQPQIYLNDKLIQRVGRPEEAYIAPACERNSPQNNMIGAIQANISYTTDFIFAPDLTQCDYFEDNLRCVTSPDSIEMLRASQEYALPLQKNIHLFTINEGVLQSTQLLSSAVRVQLHFRNYKIALQTSTICPQLDGESITTTGCYNCPILARLTFTAHSSCQPGIVSIQLQQISIHTKAVYLKLDPTTHIVKFQAEEKCATEKLCLKSASSIQCHSFKYCLEEPSVELLNLNTNYTRTVSSTTSSNMWDWLKIPNMNSSIFFLKLIGSALFILCLIITTLATLITCCCKAR